jgi:DNA-binding GntR family transcriptional regulator
LEGRIAASIAPNLTNDDFTALEQLARAIHYQPGGQQSAFWKADLAFHQYLVQRCPKLILTELWSALSSRLAMLELLFHEAFETGLIDSQEYHLVYCDELRAGEPEQARQAAEDHYARPVNHLKQAIVQKEELAMR